LPRSFEKTPMEDEERFLRVLSTSVISLTKIFINDMILNNDGKIMIVSSVAAYAPPSKIQALYGPVKTFMNRFSEALNLSYNNIGITCTALCPGYTVTNFHAASGVQDEMDRVPKFLKKSAKRIAIEGVDGMLKGKKIVVPTITWKVIVFLLKIVPKSVFDFLSSIMAPGRYDD
jgi:short-subunit dehydrogenase